MPHRTTVLQGSTAQHPYCSPPGGHRMPSCLDGGASTLKQCNHHDRDTGPCDASEVLTPNGPGGAREKSTFPARQVRSTIAGQTRGYLSNCARSQTRPTSGKTGGWHLDRRSELREPSRQPNVSYPPIPPHGTDHGAGAAVRLAAAHCGPLRPQLHRRTGARREAPIAGAGGSV